MSVCAELEAAVLPHLHYFKDDLLVHDRKAIEDHPGCPFLHWSCDSNTHILFLVPQEEYPRKDVWIPYLFGQADRNHLLKQVTEMAEYFTRPNCDPGRYAVHRYTGKRLVKIDSKQAVEIAQDYCRAIRHEWEPKRVEQFQYA